MVMAYKRNNHKISSRGPFLSFEPIMIFPEIIYIVKEVVTVAVSKRTVYQVIEVQ